VNFVRKGFIPFIVLTLCNTNHWLPSGLVNEWLPATLCYVMLSEAMQCYAVLQAPSHSPNSPTQLPITTPSFSSRRDDRHSVVSVAHNPDPRQDRLFPGTTHFRPSSDISMSLTKFQHRPAPNSPRLYLRPPSSRLTNRHLEVGRLTLPALSPPIPALIRRIDDNSSSRKAAIQTTRTTAPGCAVAGPIPVAGAGAVVCVVRVRVGIMICGRSAEVALGSVVGICVVDVEGLG
jgi:hypothetical protein